MASDHYIKPGIGKRQVSPSVRLAGGQGSMQSAAKMQRITEELDRQQREKEPTLAIVDDNDEDDRISGSCASILGGCFDSICCILPSLPFDENWTWAIDFTVNIERRGNTFSS